MKKLFTVIVLIVFYKNASCQGVLDEPDRFVKWDSFENLSENDYERKLDEIKSLDLRLVDVEVTGVFARKYSGVFRENTDNRLWQVRTKLTGSAFDEKLQEFKDQGLRPVKQESYLISNARFYGAIWVENKEDLKFESFRDLSSDQFHTKFLDLRERGFIPTDIEMYKVGNDFNYSVIWIENVNHLEWKLKRNISNTDLIREQQDNAREGFKIIDYESATLGNGQRHSIICVKESHIPGGKLERNLSLKEFTNARLHNSDAGFRLANISVYETSSGKRYAGIWAENSKRATWNLRDTINSLIDNYFDTATVTGLSVGIAVNSEIMFLSSRGFQDKAEGIEASSGTVYRLASVSKAITGVLSFKLREQGLLNINKKTCEYEVRYDTIKEYDHHKLHTVGQLLSNRGHVRHYIDCDSPFHEGTEEPIENAYEASTLFVKHPLIYNDYQYSTHGYTLAAAALEKATGKLFQTLIKEVISQPFSLTTLKCEELGVTEKNRSKIYSTSGNVIEKPLNLHWKFAGGGMESSSIDLLNFNIKLMDNKILRDTSITAMTTEPAPIDNDYAFGWMVGRVCQKNYYAKDGAQQGARSYIINIPDGKISLVILGNTSGVFRINRDLVAGILNVLCQIN